MYNIPDYIIYSNGDYNKEYAGKPDKEPVITNSRSCLDEIFLKTSTDLELLIPIIIQTNATDHFTTFNNFTSHVQE